MTTTCQWCGTALSIAENAPRVLTCPKCLAKIRNPHLLTANDEQRAALRAQAQPPPPALPRPVIPIEEQTTRDLRGLRFAGAIFALLVVAGATVAGMGFSPPTEKRLWFYGFLVLTALVAFGLTLPLPYPLGPRRKLETVRYGPTDSSRVLNYGTSTAERSAGHIVLSVIVRAIIAAVAGVLVLVGITFLVLIIVCGSIH